MLILAVICFALWYSIGNHPDYVGFKTSLLVIVFFIIVTIILIYISRFFWLFALLVFAGTMALNWAMENYSVSVVEKEKTTQLPFIIQNNEVNNE
jgi:glucan phosphoethanolaminetransferase (alkaline phosphatase superfamily)